MAYDSKTTHIVDDDFCNNFPGGKYNLIIVASKRAHDLQKGKTPLINDWKGHKWPTIALMEIEAGLIPDTYPHGFIDPTIIDKEENVE